MGNELRKHAFLIIAHNEFEVLQKLIDALDDTRNDIYVHIDGKIKNVPKLEAVHSHLNILKNRIKVIWGDVTQIACEIRLMEEAVYSGNVYAFYHIISGVHYPLISNRKLSDFFEPYTGKSVLQCMDSSIQEVEMRLGKFHFFLGYFNSRFALIRKVSRILWVAFLSVEKRMKINRDCSYQGGKASNWCSLSNEAVHFILSDKEKILKRFGKTFCADEFFVPSVIKEHHLPVVYSDKLLYANFVHYTPKVLTINDYDALMKSGCLFARKITSDNMELINRISDGKNQYLCN